MDTLYIVIGILVVIIIYMVVTMLRLRKAVTNLTQEEFIKGYRKAQLIDVREQKISMPVIFLEPEIFRTLSLDNVIKKFVRIYRHIYMTRTAEKVHVLL